VAATTPTAAFTRTLSDFAQAVELSAVPDDVKHEVSRIVLDCVGCAIAGLVTDAGRIAVDLVRDERGPLQGQVIGAGDASVMPAAFANTVLTNAIDFDVYGPEGHIAPVVVSAALAMADALDASGPELFAGLVAGLEVSGRIGGALRRPGMEGTRQLSHVRGHGHVVFGAAAAAGRLLRLSADQMHHAFGIAGYSATVPTLRKFFASANMPMTKYDHLGLMAQNGIQAALLAQRGFTGDLEVLEGDIGFWRFAGALGCDWEHLTRDLGRSWTINEVSYKPYPVGLYNGPGIHTTRRLVQENGLRPDEIEQVEVRTTRAEEGAVQREVRHSLDAWHNSAFTLTAGLFDVRPFRSWQEPRGFQRSDLLAFMERVRFSRLRDEELSTKGNYWERWSPVRVTITARGRTYEGADDYLPGLNDDELTAKFRENTDGLLNRPEAEQLADRCWNLLRLASSRDLTRLLAVQPGAAAGA
jgi:2-methylcitrate dehydratase PrpD